MCAVYWACPYRAADRRSASPDVRASWPPHRSDTSAGQPRAAWRNRSSIFLAGRTVIAHPACARVPPRRAGANGISPHPEPPHRRRDATFCLMREVLDGTSIDAGSRRTRCGGNGGIHQALRTTPAGVAPGSVGVRRHGGLGQRRLRRIRRRDAGRRGARRSAPDAGHLRHQRRRRIRRRDCRAAARSRCSSPRPIRRRSTGSRPPTQPVIG